MHLNRLNNAATQFPGGPHEGEPVADRLRTIAFPGMGTGVGKVPPEICARQIRTAILRHRDNRATLPKSWAEASEDHQLLYGDTARDLQK